jgi:hypothetical protein
VNRIISHPGPDAFHIHNSKAEWTLEWLVIVKLLWWRGWAKFWSSIFALGRSIGRLSLTGIRLHLGFNVASCEGSCCCLCQNCCRGFAWFDSVDFCKRLIALERWWHKHSFGYFSGDGRQSGGSISCPNFRRCLSQYLRYCLRLEIALPRRTARKFGALGNLFSICWMSQNSKCGVSIDVDLRYLS